MKKINYIILYLSALIFLVISCGEGSSGDKTPPTVSDVRFNVNDTIRYTDDNGIEKFVVLNSATNGNRSTDYDIIVISNPDDTDPVTKKNRPIRFFGRFADDDKLSNAFIHIWGDSTQIDPVTQKPIPIEERKDTCYHLRRLLSIQMYGQTEVIVDSMGFEVINNVDYSLSRKDQSKRLTVRPSKRRANDPEASRESDEYYYSVRCIDAAGNENVDAYTKYPIELRTYKSIIEDHKNNIPI